MNTWGSKLKVSIFGESHGTGIGVVLDGIPAGTKLDTEEIRRNMLRRAPGRDKVSTPRQEGDQVEILSGVVNDITTGTPICGIIRNTDTRSRDYTPNLLRPGHADFTGFEKYGESHDFRGGGHFSGRITAPLVFAGAIARQILANDGITIGAHIKAISDICESSFLDTQLSPTLLSEIAQKSFPVLCDEKGEEMQSVILAAAADKDSVGGVIECAVLGIKPGFGSPFFASVESLISSMMFSIPAVKGIEFGRGFDLCRMKGAEANDPFATDGERIFTTSNHNGGINGGITNGMPVIFSLAIKPTPSIGKEQQTVDRNKMENTTLEIKGRHDPCIVQRAVVVAECATALAILEAKLI